MVKNDSSGIQLRSTYFSKEKLIEQDLYVFNSDLSYLSGSKVAFKEVETFDVLESEVSNNNCTIKGNFKYR